MSGGLRVIRGACPHNSAAHMSDAGAREDGRAIRTTPLEHRGHPQFVRASVRDAESVGRGCHGRTIHGRDVNILYVSHSFPLPGEPLSNVGGMQRVAVDLYQALCERADLTVTPLLLETSWKLTGLRTGPFLGSLVWRIPRAVRKEGIDVVLFSSMVTAAVAPALKRRLAGHDVRLAAIPVGRDLTLPNRVYQRYLPRVLDALDHIFPISRATAEAALVRGAAPDRVRIVPCGVDLPRIARSEAAEVARRQLCDWLVRRGVPVDGTETIILSVGRHQERKGFHWFVNAVMPRLARRAVYLLAGSGPMTPIIRERIAARGLEDRVHLAGQVPDDTLRLFYAGSDVFVMPNIPVAGDIEGFGVVMIEAGAAGLPVVAADLEGIRDVIGPGENGWLAPSGDGEAFVRAIEEVAGSQDRSGLRARAAQYVRDHFGWEAIAERYVRALRIHTDTSGANDAKQPPENGNETPEHLRDEPHEQGFQEKSNHRSNQVTL